MEKIQLHGENSNENMYICGGFESWNSEDLCFCGEKHYISLTDNVQSVQGNSFLIRNFRVWICVRKRFQNLPK